MHGFYITDYMETDRSTTYGCIEAGPTFARIVADSHRYAAELAEWDATLSKVEAGTLHFNHLSLWSRNSVPSLFVQSASQSIY